jgi:hypothetical protein
MTLTEPSTALFRPRPVLDDVLHSDGRRIVKRIATTFQRLYRDGRLTPALLSGLDDFIRTVARAEGVATEDRHESTAKLISPAYEGMPLAQTWNGWSAPSDSRLKARREADWITARIPPELRDLFDMIVAEEIGTLTGEPLTLQQIDERRGYLHKQAPASAGTQVYDLLAMIGQLRRDFLNEQRRGNTTPNSREKMQKRQIALEQIAVHLI